MPPKRTLSIPKREAATLFAPNKPFCALLLVLLSLFLLSCGGGINSGEMACNAQQGTTCQALTVNGVTRTYLLHVPSNFQKSTGALVIVLHGPGGNGLGMEIGTGFSKLADRAGFAVAYPDGLNDDFLFPSFRLKGRKPQRTNMLVANHLQPAARKAGITGQVGVHTLRRTLASARVANGNDIRLVRSCCATLIL